MDMEKLIFVSAVALMTATAFAAAGNVERCNMVVEEIRFDENCLWTDTIGFGSGECNYGDPQKIARWQGADVKVGYDYNYLEHIVYHNGKQVAMSPTLLVDSVDVVHNKVIFSYGTRHKVVDFNRGDAMASLLAFMAPPAGWTSGGLSYSYDEFYKAGTSDAGGEQYYKWPLTRRFVMSYPADKAKAERFFRLLQSDRFYPDIYVDSICSDDEYAVDMQGFVEWIANSKPTGEDCVYVAAPANRKCIPMAGMNNTTEYFVDYCDGDIITVGRTDNKTYPAGGCRSSSTYYRTYDLDGGRPVGFDDIFDTKHMKDILMKVSAAIAKDLWESEIGWYDYDNDVEFMPYTPEEVYEMSGFSCGLEQDGTIGKVLYYTALSSDGVIFGYDLSCFTDFGEDPICALVIPYDDLRPYLRAGIR